MKFEITTILGNQLPKLVTNHFRGKLLSSLNDGQLKALEYNKEIIKMEDEPCLN